MKQRFESVERSHLHAPRTLAPTRFTPTGCSPHQRRHLLWLQKGRSHFCTMLERTSIISAKSHPKEKNGRHVCTSKEEAPLPYLPRLPVPDHGTHLYATNTRRNCQPPVTPAYNILLGMEFIRAARGAYDSYTRLFTYRYFGPDGCLKSSSLSAPVTPPLLQSWLPLSWWA